jgi:hypothetical protein
MSNHGNPLIFLNIHGLLFTYAAVQILVTD